MLDSQDNQSNQIKQNSFQELQWEAFCTAVQFLTRIPISGGAMAGGMERYQSALARSVIYFPLVGGLVCLSTAIVLSLFRGPIPLEIAVVVALAFEAMVTGAFHEDALADTCDALGGGWTREQVLEILKDSRLGTYGTLGLGLGVACRFFCIVALLGSHSYWYGAVTLVASGAIGRWAILWLMHTVQPIEDRHTQARDVAGQQTSKSIGWSALIALPLVLPWIVADFVGVLVGLALSAMALYAYRWQILRRVGGSTGDMLGCGCYFIQLVILIVAASR